MKLRFSIRDLLWLKLVAAMAVAWWIDHRTMRDELDDFVGVRGGLSEGRSLYFRKSQAWKSEIPDPTQNLIP
jgi:hypothetical protein